jgi:hypothetical protein
VSTYTRHFWLDKGFFFKFLQIVEVKTPQVGFEPTTNRLTVDRSTTELLRNAYFIVQKAVTVWQGFSLSQLDFSDGVRFAVSVNSAGPYSSSPILILVS